MKTKAWVVDKHKEKITFSCNGIDLRDLKNGEVRIKPFFSSVNYRDLLAISGDIGVAGKWPYVPGVDFVGEVQESFCRELVCGDKVFAFALPNDGVWPGVWSKSFIAKGKFIRKLPDNISPIDLATFGTAGFAAGVAFNLIQKNVSDKPVPYKIAITGASGGVGSFSIILAKLFKHKVYAFSQSKSDSKTSYLYSLGADLVTDIEKLKVKHAQRLLPDRYDAVIDSLGGTSLAELLKQVKNRGVIVAAGMAESILVDNIDLAPFLLRGVKLCGTGSEIINERESNEVFKVIFSVLNKIDFNLIRETFDFDQVDLAVDKMKADKLGRLVIKINER
ncbi:zinc-binding dehydrogenase [Alphaproteobacteria bacterium]|nr:zinc-binding dehydrogenase [Alphaproteobacteria bacterium]